MKKVLLLCASHNDLGTIRALKKLNYYIISTGNVFGLVGQNLTDEYIQMDYSDKDKILELAKEKKIDAICQCCNDFGVYTAAYVAEKLELPGYDSYETTLILHNKDRFKKLAKKIKLLSPETESFCNKADAMRWLENADFPIIIKPTDASAGNGIQKVDTIEDVANAVDYAFSKSRCHKIVIEPYIDGTQHGFCTFLVNQKVVASCSNDEYSLLNPYRVEIDTFPADNNNETERILIAEIETIAQKLALHDGIFHLQYIMKDGMPYIIEVMRRVPGNMYFVPGNIVSGIDWEYWETRARCGLPCDSINQDKKSGIYCAYKTILANSNGVIQTILLPEQYNHYIYDKFFLKKVGDTISNFMSEPIGFLFMKFDSMEQMKRILIDEYDNNIVEIKEG